MTEHERTALWEAWRLRPIPDMNAIKALLEDVRYLERQLRHFRHPHLEFDFTTNSGFRAKGENMTFTFNSNQTVGVTVSPVDANGNPAKATLSAVAFTSSDSTIFTVAADPANPLGGILTAVAAGSATLSATATVTQADGTTGTLSGTASITVAAAVNPATGLAFTFGTPATKS